MRRGRESTAGAQPVTRGAGVTLRKSAAVIVLFVPQLASQLSHGGASARRIHTLMLAGATVAATTWRISA
jgi:hypothetical protein